MAHGSRYRRSLLLLLLLPCLLMACIRPRIEPVGFEPIDESRLPAADRQVLIPGLGPCSDRADRTLSIASDQPVTVLVHGCYGSAGRFRALSQVFAFHGQQTACFSYDYLDSLTESSDQLRRALNDLHGVLDEQPIQIVAHSQGGLIGRRALTRSALDGADAPPTASLTTISTPFAGIAAASHCGSPTLHAVSLGITVGVCRLISGDKWWEITAASDFIQQPGQLRENISTHLKIVTDERGSCRQRNERGRCVEDDFVFSLEEQYYPPVDNHPRVTNRQVSVGHAAIVGDEDRAPQALIEILQSEGIMHRTEQDRKAALSHLLARLY